MSKSFVLKGAAVLCMAIGLYANASLAQQVDAVPTANNPPPQNAQTTEDNYNAFLQRAGKMGPAQIALGEQALLDMPQGFAFIPEGPAKKIMQRMGNNADENFLGLILPSKQDSWFISVYFPSGYIKDDDAKTWDADKLLNEIQQSTEESNKRRAKQGMPSLEVVGWVEKPHYDELTHKLVWSIAARDKGGANDGKSIINYRTLMLGRDGYIEYDKMVTDLAAIEGQKSIANLLLSKLNFDGGKRYTDFNVSTDRVAEYGLAALVAGIAAKKLGLFAVAAAFAAKFVKVGILAVMAFFAGLRKKFRRSKTQEVELITPPSVAETSKTDSQQ